ncbi:MAG: hypothetical protein Ct9H90mP14_3140 [Methanobacteriota archaeon]|nr:MAG: hypothetical protein Ct9H90mP14_3140 [Euryarchaeota archaeon]
MGAKVVVVDLPFRWIQKKKSLNPCCCNFTKTVLAMIDTVTSPPGLRMPFEKLSMNFNRGGRCFA